MRDEGFELFIEEFGEATFRAEVPAARIEAYRGRLPRNLLKIWKDEGWCAYADGLVWTVDPDDYEDLIDEWLDGTGLDEIDSFHVIARSAFGDLYVCGEKTGYSVTVACYLNSIYALSSDLRTRDELDREVSVETLFAGHEREYFDSDDGGKSLFDKALKRLGPLLPDEMYGFEPALVAGGAKTLENLRKVKLDAHLTILRQLADPTLPMARIDIDKLRS